MKRRETKRRKEKEIEKNRIYDYKKRKKTFLKASKI